MLITRTLTALALLLIFEVVTYFGGYEGFLIITTLFVSLAVWEIASLTRCSGLLRLLLCVVFVAVAGALGGMSPDAKSLPMLWAFSAAAWVIAVIGLLLGLQPSRLSFLQVFARYAGTDAEQQPRLEKPVVWQFFYWISLLAALTATWEAYQRGMVFLLSLLMIVWLADIGAYAIGRSLGRHKLAPAISPGKSIEGAVGGLIIVGGWALISMRWDGTLASVLREQWSVAGSVGAIMGLGVLSIGGDLMESLLKRRAGVKDASNLLPGHGGVLDRIDSLLPVLPLAMLWVIL